MIDTDKLSKNVLRDLLESIGGPEDEALDKVRHMTPERAWITWCEYNGLIGMAEILRDSMMCIYASDESFFPEKRAESAPHQYDNYHTRRLGMRSIG